MTDVRILTEPLGGSPLSLLLQQGDAPLAWLAPAPVDAAGWTRRVRQRAEEQDWSAHWERLVPALAPSGAAAARLARVRAGRGVVVTTGQQPGLFGGPVYTWSKAMSALALADAIEAATGTPTIPVFWAATDDADFAEASSTVVARTGGADRLRDDSAPPAGTPMSLAPLGDLGPQLAALATAGGSGADGRPIAVVRDAYAADGRTVGSAYVALLRGLLEPLGVVVLDASHPAVIAASAGPVSSAIAGAAGIEAALARRSAELHDHGHAPQVEDMPGMSLVFERRGTVKRRLATGEAPAPDAVVTPNVLLRPIVEHEILPTVAYVAGPGELAYFAQVGAVATAMGLATPIAVPRWSCTLLEPHVEAALQRLGLQREDLSTLHSAERRLASEAMSERTRGGLEALRAAISALPAGLGDEPRALGLDAAVVGAVRALEHRAARLERRLLAGIARRETDVARDLATARAALYPFGARQERTLNLLPILTRHGLELLAEMRQAAGAHARALVGEAVSTELPAPVA